MVVFEICAYDYLYKCVWGLMCNTMLSIILSPRQIETFGLSINTLPILGQHLLKTAVLVQLLHIGAASDELSVDKDARNLPTQKLRKYICIMNM